MFIKSNRSSLTFAVYGISLLYTNFRENIHKNCTITQTLNYLTEHNLLEYAELAEKAAAAAAHHNELSAQIEEVYAALMKLPAIQARRIYARFYLGMTVAEIAKVEGVDRRRVWASIRRGLKKLAYLLDANK